VHLLHIVGGQRSTPTSNQSATTGESESNSAKIESRDLHRRPSGVTSKSDFPFFPCNAVLKSCALKDEKRRRTWRDSSQVRRRYASGVWRTGFNQDGKLTAPSLLRSSCWIFCFCDGNSKQWYHTLKYKFNTCWVGAKVKVNLIWKSHITLFSCFVFVLFCNFAKILRIFLVHVAQSPTLFLRNNRPRKRMPFKATLLCWEIHLLFLLSDTQNNHFFTNRPFLQKHGRRKVFFQAGTRGFF